MYLSMPFLFALFTKRWARWRQTAAICGTAVSHQFIGIYLAFLDKFWVEICFVSREIPVCSRFVFEHINLADVESLPLDLMPQFHTVFLQH